MANLYVPSGVDKFFPDRPVDMSRCRAQVYEPVSRNFSQCSRKKTVEMNSVGYCKQHDPSAEAARAKLSHAKWEAECRRSALGFYGERFMAALIKIRDGDNDPRETARLALDGCKYATPELGATPAMGDET